MIASPLATASWNESEALALRAALSVIDTWDGDLGGLLEIDSDSSSSSDASQPKKRRSHGAKTTHRDRQARKHEIKALQAQARDLQYVVALGKALVGGASSAKARAVESTALTSEWERLAATQRSQRLAAEQENARLRNFIRSQVEYAHHMLHLTRQVDQVKKALYVAPLPSFVNYIGPSIEPETHLRDMDTLVSRAVRIFSTGPFDSSNGLQYFHQTEFRSDRPAEEGADLESQGVSVLPFDVRRVADAMWVHTIRPTRNSKLSMDIYENANAVVSQFMGTSCFDDRFGVIQGQVAARMLPPDLGDGSILIVTKMVANTLTGSQVLGCVESDGWIRIESLRSKDPARVTPLTVVKWYRRMLMSHPPSPTASKRDRCEWTEAVITGPIRSRFEQEFDTCVLAIENMLLSRAPALSLA